MALRPSLESYSESTPLVYQIFFAVSSSNMLVKFSEMTAGYFTNKTMFTLHQKTCFPPTQVNLAFDGLQCVHTKHVYARAHIIYNIYARAYYINIYARLCVHVFSFCAGLYRYT